MITSMDLDQDYAQFTQRLKLKAGIDLAQYKETQMKRRLRSFIEKKGFKTFADFYNTMIRNQQLFDEFLDQMTINVSEFYRNPKRWEVLEKRIIPDILSRSPRIKSWSAACSTGEEPYSLVMALSSFFNLREIQVLATDIDQAAIGKAKLGRYQQQSVKDVPKPHLSKFFSVRENQYFITDEVKKCVQFKKQNLLADPFDTGFDLIICRNVLIYFTEEAKDALFHKFSKSLKKGGYIFIGGTEQIFEPQKYQLGMIDTFFYKKI